MRGRRLPRSRSGTGVALGFVVPLIAVAWTFALHRMLLWTAITPGGHATHAGGAEASGQLIVGWAAAAALYVTLRMSHRVGTGAQPALALAAFALAALESTSLSRWMLDAASLPRGVTGADHFRACFHLLETTASLAYGLGMGLALIVGVVDFVRIRRGQGWAVDDA